MNIFRKNKPSFWSKTTSLWLVFFFVLNTCSYGLAPLPASRNPVIQQEILSELQRREAGLEEKIAGDILFDPFISSRDLCEKYGIRKDRLVDIYVHLRNNPDVHKRWAASKYREFFGIAAQLLANQARIEQIVRGEFTFPVFVEFHSGGRCPNNCTFCYNKFVDDFKDPVKRSGMIDLPRFLRIIDEISANGATTLNIAGGGEPLNDNVSIEGLKYAKSKGLTVTLNTMGIGLDRDEIIESILNIDQLRVSINSSTPETYELISGKGRGVLLGKVCASVAKIVRMRKERNSKLKIVASFIIIPENYREMEAMVELGYRLGVDSVYLRPDYAGITRPFNDGEIEEIKEIVTAIKARVSKGDFAGLNVSIGDVFNKSEAGDSEQDFRRIVANQRCWSQRFKIGIDAWGRVHECALTTQPGVGKMRHVIGDLRQDASLMTVLRRALSRPLPPVSACQGQGITCNIFEGYFHAFIDKLKRDAEYGIPVSLQPYHRAARSLYTEEKKPDRFERKSGFDPFDILSSQRGRDLIAEWIGRYPNKERMVSEDQITKFVAFLGDAGNRHGNLEDEIRRLFPYLETMQKSYEAVNTQQSRAPPPAIGRALLFKKYVKGPVVADVGCGWNTTGAEIVKNNPDVEQVIGVDIEDQTKGNLPGKVSFRLMPDPLTIPLPDSSADTVILSFVLHHVAVDSAAFMREVKRVLRPAGRVIVLEDTFSSRIEPQEAGRLSNMFFDLPSDKERLSFLWFVDWFIHNFVNRSRQPLVPGNYRTIEEWAGLFDAAGFVVQEKGHLGFAEIGSRNPVNRGLIVLEKTGDISDIGLMKPIMFESSALGNQTVNFEKLSEKMAASKLNGAQAMAPVDGKSCLITKLPDGSVEVTGLPESSEAESQASAAHPLVRRTIDLFNAWRESPQRFDAEPPILSLMDRIDAPESEVAAHLEEERLIRLVERRGIWGKLDDPDYVRLSQLYCDTIERHSTFFASLGSIAYLAQFLRERNEPFPHHILDLGSGPSVFCRAYERMKPYIGLSVAPSPAIVDFDIDPNMLRRGTNPYKRVSGDLNSISSSFGEGMFDFVNSSFSFMYAKDPVKTLTDINAILKENGLLLIMLQRYMKIPDTFYDGLSRLGFEVQHKPGAMLKRDIDRASYEYLVDRYGPGLAAAIRDLMSGNHNFILARKTGRPLVGVDQGLFAIKGIGSAKTYVQKNIERYIKARLSLPPDYYMTGTLVYPKNAREKTDIKDERDKLIELIGIARQQGLIGMAGEIEEICRGALLHRREDPGLDAIIRSVVETAFAGGPSVLKKGGSCIIGIPEAASGALIKEIRAAFDDRVGVVVIRDKAALSALVRARGVVGVLIDKDMPGHIIKSALFKKCIYGAGAIAGSRAVLSVDDIIESADAPRVSEGHSTDENKTEARLATILISRLLDTQLHADRVYEIKYDTSLLSASQISIIEEYVRLLQSRASDPKNIRAKPFSSTHGSKESLIAAYCTGKGFKGEGHVDVTVPDGELREYLLGVTGMINIALASSSIPDDLSVEDIDAYRPLMRYIKNQYRLLVGDDIIIPNSPDDALKVIRRVVLSLPRSMRMDTNRIEELDRLAKESLAAA